MSSRWIERVWHTLGLRLALWYSVLFAGSSIVLVALTYVLLASSLEQRDREIVETTLARYASQYQAGGLRALDRAIQADRVAGRHERLFVRVLGTRQEAIFFTIPADWREFDLGQLATPPLLGAREWAQLEGRTGDAVLEVASLRLRDGTLVQVGKSSESRVELLERFRSIVTIVLVSIVAIGLTGGAILTYSALQPIRNLIAAVRSILQTGRMEARVPVRATGDALDELGVLFNSMLNRIERLIAGMRGSLDHVAHDLRTPMMRLRGIAEDALRHGRGSDDYREALADCLEESDRVVMMLNTLMDISEAETGTMELRLEPVDLATTVRDAVDLYADVAEEKGIVLSAKAADGLQVTADESRMRQVVANLLDNAVKYTPSGGRIEVEAYRDANRAVLAVQDTGVGIPPEELPRIWERLYRGDKSRSERGLGLGLSLVKAIVAAHGGQVYASSAPGMGARFVLSLPTPE